MIFDTSRTGSLSFVHRGERVLIEPWGENAVRVRSSPVPGPPSERWALHEAPQNSAVHVTFQQIPVPEEDGTCVQKTEAALDCGRLRVTVSAAGVLSFFRDNDLLFREYSRAYENTLTRESRCLKVDAREWKGIPGGSEFALAARIESDPNEKIFGMGQYQQLPMNLKGCLLELAQRNSQISVPFALSSRGYGFL